MASRERADGHKCVKAFPGRMIGADRCGIDFDVESLAKSGEVGFRFDGVATFDDLAECCSGGKTKGTAFTIETRTCNAIGRIAPYVDGNAVATGAIVGGTRQAFGVGWR